MRLRDYGRFTFVSRLFHGFLCFLSIRVGKVERFSDLTRNDLRTINDLRYLVVDVGQSIIDAGYSIIYGKHLFPDDPHTLVDGMSDPQYFCSSHLSQHV